MDQYKINLTKGQQASVCQLLLSVGKQRFRVLKVELGISIDTAINKLSMAQASQLINRMQYKMSWL